MLSGFQFILIPLLASILLLTITSYFGIHILKREIIFIDIAMAQIAALGGAITLLIEHQLQLDDIIIANIDVSDVIAYFFSILFCLLAALLFTFLKNPKIKISIEAFIGITYAFATTATVIILDKGAGGDVHLHDMFTGVLLWTNWQQLLRLFIVILIIGGFHIVFRKQFIYLTESYQERKNTDRKNRIWDFLFYLTFGIIIIEAIRIGGILTVFAFLIIPASFSAFFASTWFSRILYGISAGAIASILGLLFSLKYDLTSSPLIIIFLGIILAGGIIIRRKSLRI